MEATAIDLVCHDLPLHVVPSDVAIESLKPRSCAYSLRLILRDCSLTIVWFYSRTLKSHLMLGTRPFCSRFYYLPVLDTRGSRFCVPSSNHACDEYCPHDETLRISFFALRSVDLLFMLLSCSSTYLPTIANALRFSTAATNKHPLLLRQITQLITRCSPSSPLPFNSLLLQYSSL